MIIFVICALMQRYMKHIKFTQIDSLHGVPLPTTQGTLLCEDICEFILYFCLKLRYDYCNYHEVVSFDIPRPTAGLFHTSPFSQIPIIYKYVAIFVYKNTIKLFVYYVIVIKKST